MRRDLWAAIALVSAACPLSHTSMASAPIDRTWSVTSSKSCATSVDTLKLDDAGLALAPLPPWPPICGPAAPSAHSLWTHWLDMRSLALDPAAFGDVGDDLGMLAWALSQR